MVVYLYLNSVLYNAVDKPGLKITYLDKKGEKMLTRRRKKAQTNKHRQRAGDFVASTCSASVFPETGHSRGVDYSKMSEVNCLEKKRIKGQRRGKRGRGRRRSREGAGEKVTWGEI